MASVLAALDGELPAFADAPPEPEDYSLHGQFTFVEQFHPGFTSPYRGPDSLDPGSRGDETFDATVFAGLRLPLDVEAYADAEIDQGFGLSDTVGVAGFTSAEAYKVGASEPYIRLTRAFLRRVIGFGGEVQAVDPDQNQLGGSMMSNNLILTAGKLSVPDIFDTNKYAHDPKNDFLNWAVVDGGAFDYAADAWGYSYGAAAEWNEDWWTLRAGLFDLSRVPNGKYQTRGFGEYEIVAEVEERHRLLGQAGKLKLLAFVNRGNMADYTAAIRLARETGGVPDVSKVRGFASRPGASIDIEQALTADLGAFLRVSVNDGHKEAFEFTDVNRSASAGISWNGASWGRANDTVGLAGIVNGLSDDARAYFAAGGLGILVGDGRLPHYSAETILETYYEAAIVEGFAVTFDYQFVDNPAYNIDRGPVSVIGFRVHAQI